MADLYWLEGYWEGYWLPGYWPEETEPTPPLPPPHGDPALTREDMALQHVQSRVSLRVTGAFRPGSG